MASINDVMTNSGEFVCSDVQNRERWGGVEMEEEKISSRQSFRPFYRERWGCFRLLLTSDGRDPAAV
jgi:hypothetical protein